MIISSYESDIDSEGYYATPFISQSMVGKVDRKTLDDWDKPLKDTEEMAIGRAGHAITLEGIEPPRSLKPPSKKLVLEMRDKLFENEVVRSLFRMDHKSEKSYFGKIEVGEEKLVEDVRARLDYQNEFASGDLKFTSEPGTCNSRYYIEKWGLHIQAGFYQAMREKVEGTMKPFFLIICHYNPIVWIEVLTFEQNWCDVGLSMFNQWAYHIARKKRDPNYEDPRYVFKGAQKIEGEPRRKTIL